MIVVGPAGTRSCLHPKGLGLGAQDNLKAVTVKPSSVPSKGPGPEEALLVWCPSQGVVWCQGVTGRVRHWLSVLPRPPGGPGPALSRHRPHRSCPANTETVSATRRDRRTAAPGPPPKILNSPGTKRLGGPGRPFATDSASACQPEYSNFEVQVVVVQHWHCQWHDHDQVEWFVARPGPAGGSLTRSLPVTRRPGRSATRSLCDSESESESVRLGLRVGLGGPP
jgi:hypothetical protein